MKSALFLGLCAALLCFLSPIQSGAQQFFPSESSIAVGQRPGEIATADLNDDGHADMAVVDLFGQTVFVCLGNGDATFQAAVEYVTGYNPWGVSFSDLDNDGDLDMVVANSGENHIPTGDISVFAGNGDGSFQDAVHFGESQSPSSLAIDDFDGDGKQDLVVGHYAYSHITVYLGNGDCTFQVAVDYEADSLPHRVATADLDNDTIPDVAVSNYTGHTISVLLGNGDGTFSAVEDNTVLINPEGLAIGDLDQDGNLDLACSHNTRSVSVLRGNGDGTFQHYESYYISRSHSRTILMKDFNEDGNLDLAIPNYYCSCVVFLLGHGDGTFGTPIEYSTTSSPVWGATLDADGDGHLDIVTSRTDYDALAVMVNSADTGIHAELTCTPSAGSLPFTTHISAAVSHDFFRQNRLIAARIDLYLANGGYISQWREAYAPVPFGSIANPAWNQVIPRLGSLLGDNTFELVVEDVTYAPYNQPPFLPAGQTDSDTCVVTASFSP